MTDIADLLPRAAAVIAEATADGVMIATAESCTGGLVAGLLTEVPGSSSVVDRGFVTYSNEAKAEMIGVSPVTIESHGAVSAETAAEMARGALQHSRADIAVAITGIAGPGGGSATKPVGLVHFALARRPSGVVTIERRFGDIGRDRVRHAAVETALRLIEEALGIAAA